MPTAVLDLDLTKLPSEIGGLKAYDRAFILLRYKGRPVGKIMVPVTNGSIIIENYYPGFINAVEPELKTAWLHDHLQWDETDIIDFTPPKAQDRRPQTLFRIINAIAGRWAGNHSHR